MSADYSSTGMGTVKCGNATLERRLTRQQVQRDAAVSHKIAATHANASPSSSLRGKATCAASYGILGSRPAGGKSPRSRKIAYRPQI